mmetsp:Transcript_29301/g.52390  ORF Transcript_29301/g.52390 Transcript_29301/m.52390 type:complete len:288 (-) Transcript_29301:681-1544(-)
MAVNRCFPSLSTSLTLIRIGKVEPSARQPSSSRTVPAASCKYFPMLSSGGWLPSSSSRSDDKLPAFFCSTPNIRHALVLISSMAPQLSVVMMAFSAEFIIAAVLRCSACTRASCSFSLVMSRRMAVKRCCPSLFTSLMLMRIGNVEPSTRRPCNSRTVPAAPCRYSNTPSSDGWLPSSSSSSDAMFCPSVFPSASPKMWSALVLMSSKYPSLSVVMMAFSAEFIMAAVFRCSCSTLDLSSFSFVMSRRMAVNRCCPSLLTSLTLMRIGNVEPSARRPSNSRTVPAAL